MTPCMSDFEMIELGVARHISNFSNEEVFGMSRSSGQIYKCMVIVASQIWVHYSKC